MPTKSSSPTAQPKYPEHEKLSLVRDKSQACGEFMEWLTGERGLHVARFVNESSQTRIVEWEPLLNEFFGIDAKQLEREKRAMLAELREAQQPLRATIQHPRGDAVNVVVPGKEA